MSFFHFDRVSLQYVPESDSWLLTVPTTLDGRPAWILNERVQSVVERFDIDAVATVVFSSDEPPTIAATGTDALVAATHDLLIALHNSANAAQQDGQEREAKVRVLEGAATEELARVSAHFAR